jgi:PncC family amidohydrolase
MNKDVFETVNRVHKVFKEKGLTLSTAESCTGGLIAHYLTSIPGASTFFMGGVISYSESVKRVIPGISSDTIRKYGIVSEKTAREMAEKIRLFMKTDCSLSASGNLGPGVLEGKEKGLIYIASSMDGNTISRELRLTGNREENKSVSSLSAMKLILELVQE